MDAVDPRVPATAASDATSPLQGLALCDWPELPAAVETRPEGLVELPDDRLNVRIVVGRFSLDLGPTQALPAGQVVVLDHPAQAPVEIWAAGQLVARGQLRTLDGHYCVQIDELLSLPTRKSR